jgi:hypothetical protein
MHLYVQFLVSNLRNICAFCLSSVYARQIQQTLLHTTAAIEDFLRHQPSRFCVQLRNNKSTSVRSAFPQRRYPAHGTWNLNTLHGVGSVSVACNSVYSLFHYECMKANDSSFYVILCWPKHNSTQRWSVQNVSVKVNKSGNDWNRTANFCDVCLWKPRQKEIPEQNAKLGWTGEISKVLNIKSQCKRWYEKSCVYDCFFISPFILCFTNVMLHSSKNYHQVRTTEPCRLPKEVVAAWGAVMLSFHYLPICANINLWMRNIDLVTLSLIYRIEESCPSAWRCNEHITCPVRCFKHTGTNAKARNSATSVPKSMYLARNWDIHQTSRKTCTLLALLTVAVVSYGHSATRYTLYL